MSYNEIYEKALLTNKKSFGINGEEVLIISKTEIGKLIWDLAKELKVSGIITINTSAKVLSNVISSSSKKKIIYIQLGNDESFFINNYYLNRTLYNIFPKLRDNFLKNSRYIIEVFFKRFHTSNKICGIYTLDKLTKDNLRIFLSLIKNVIIENNPPLRSCVLCNSHAYPNSWEVPSFRDVVNLFFNLPICINHTIDYYRIALEYRDNKFDIDYFIKNPKEYMLKNPIRKCLKCNRTFRSSLPFCRRCLKDEVRYLIEISYGLVEPQEPKELIRDIKCVDCGIPLTREGLCEECERQYNWLNISNDLDNGTLDWNEFLNNPSIRAEYLL